MKSNHLQMSGKILAAAFLLATLAARAADTSTNTPATNAPPRLVIVKAVYGDPSDPSSSSDVTATVAGMVKGDSLAVDASNDNFGDPASGVCKQLRVDFTIDGVAGSKSVYERGRLRLSLVDKPEPKSGPPRLVIRKAVYGVLPDGDTIDVTSIVAGMVRSNALAFTVNNADLGDPAPDDAKKLRVDFSLDGKDGSQTVDQGKTLNIPAVGK